MQRIYWGRTNNVKIWLTTESGEAYFSAPTSVWCQVYASAPERSDILAQTGGILGVAVTTGSTQTDGSYQIVLPQLADPNPNTEDTYIQYWLGVRYIPASGGQAQCHIEEIRAERDFVFLNRLGITQAIIESYDRNAGFLFGANSSLLANLTKLVEGEFRKFFKTRNVALEDIKNMSDFQAAAVYKILMYAHISEIEVTGDGHDRKAQLYKGLAATALEQAPLELGNSIGATGRLPNSIRVYG